MNVRLEEKRAMIETTANIGIREHCMLFGLSVSSYYYRAPPFFEEDEQLMALLDEHYLQTALGLRACRICYWKLIKPSIKPNKIKAALAYRMRYRDLISLGNKEIPLPPPEPMQSKKKG